MIPVAENPEDDAIELAEALRPTLRRRLGFLGGGLILLAAGIGGVLGLLTGATADIVSAILLGLITLVGGKLTLLGARGRPLLEGNEDGLIDRTSHIGGELFIPWSDVDGVSTGRVHAGVRVELKENADCLRGLGLGRLVQRAFAWLRGFRGIEIDPSFMQLDYRRLGRVLDELAIHHQVCRIRESGGIADPDRVLQSTSSDPEPT